MANVAHSTLTGSDLHEPKGVASATAGTVYVANGSGSGSWTAQSGATYAHFRELQSQGTSGGTATAGSWLARTLNTSVTNGISGASLATNTITLPAGTYRVDAIAPFGPILSGIVKVRFRNTSDSTTTCLSQGATGSYSPILSLGGWFTIATSKNFQLQYYINGTAGSNTSALGAALNAGSESEVFSEVFLWKL